MKLNFKKKKKQGRSQCVLIAHVPKLLLFFKSFNKENRTLTNIISWDFSCYNDTKMLFK